MASLRFVSQKLVSPSAAEDLTTFLTNTNTYLGTVLTQSAGNGFINNKVWNYWAVQYGNAFSSEQGFVSDGSPYYQNGPAWDPATTLVPLASSGKLFTAVVWCKLVEDGILSSNMKISQFLSTGWLNKNFAYYTNGTGYEMTNFGLQLNQTGYMSNTGIVSGAYVEYIPSGASVNYFNTNNIQIAALLNWNFGALYDGFQFGSGKLIANVAYADYASRYNQFPEGTNMAAAASLFSLASYNYQQAGDFNDNQINFGGMQVPSYIWFNMTGNSSYNGLTVQQIMDQQFLSFTTGTHSSGSDLAIPLAFKTNTNAWGGNGLVTWNGTNPFSPNCPTGNANYFEQQPYGQRSQLANYSINYEILGYIMDVAIRQNYNASTFPYANFAEYARAKIMTPLNMTRSFIVNQEIPNASSPTPNIASLRYNPYQYMCTPCVIRANATAFGGQNLLTTGGINQYFNGNPDPAYSQSAFAAAMPAVTLYGSGANYISSGATTYGPIDISSDGFGSKYFNTILAKGANTSDIPIGGTPMIATLSDWSKLLVMILQGGKATNGQRVINKQSIDSIFSSRTDALASFMNSNLLAAGQLGTAYGLGIGSTNSGQGMTTSTDLNLTSSWGEPGAYNTMSWMDRASGYYYTAVGSCINRIWNFTIGFPDVTDYNYDLSPLFGFNSLNYKIIRTIINKNA